MCVCLPKLDVSFQWGKFTCIAGSGVQLAFLK